MPRVFIAMTAEVTDQDEAQEIGRQMPNPEGSLFVMDLYDDVSSDRMTAIGETIGSAFRRALFPND